MPQTGLSCYVLSMICMTENILQHISDEQLAERAQNGDTDSFGILVERYETKLERYARKFFANSDDRTDLVQDVFLRAYQNIQGFSLSMSFSSWIYRIAHNIFIDSLRKKTRQPLIFIDFDTFLYHPIYEDEEHSASSRSQMREILEKGLDKLAVKYREVLVLYYFEEFAYKEIADILSIPTSTVSIRIKRGKEALRKILEKTQ